MNISLAQKHYEQALAFERQTIRIALEVGEPIEPLRDNRLAGDPYLLRGIPVVGVHGGLGGATAGSKPHEVGNRE